MAGKAEPRPRKGRLKVFRTAIGFHDAYVAAPSRKAALAAWGTDKDLFARGVAEEVTDPAQMDEPLSAPGTVFRQLRSMPPDEPEAKPATRRRKAPHSATREHTMQPVPPAPPPPRPSKEELEEAEQAIEAARHQHAQEQRELSIRERKLADERKAMEASQARKERQLTTKLDAARQDYQERMEAWRAALNHAQEHDAADS
jgi:hypothetical protein